jgi:Ca2+-binding EF-hand superfamily protein
LRVADGLLRVVCPDPGSSNDFEATARFYRAQFRQALGGRAALAKKQVEEDESLRALAALFDSADQNGDGELSAEELERFLRLVGLGVGCQAVLEVEDRGQNLFDLLDRDGDGRLDLRELNAALAAVAAAGVQTPVSREDLPRQLRASVRRGTPGNRFGPVALARPHKPSTATTRKAAGPRWFRALDRNNDGFLSPREFPGPPEVFRKLDLDGDGVISAEEAEKAEARDRP